jgi:FlaA1/EpsC-like NDP-sugar epimerase
MVNSSDAGLRLARQAARLRSDAPLALLDAVLVAGAFTAVLVLRFDGLVPADYWQPFRGFLPLAIAVVVASNGLCGLYGQMWRHASIVEARRILLSACVSVTVLGLLFLVGERRIPASVVVLGTAIGCGLVGVLRFQSRLFGFRRRQGDVELTRVLVIGAGESGGAILREMLREANPTVRPIGVLDDDPRKQGLSMLGVPVLGTINRLPEIAAQRHADQVLLAIPSAHSDVVNRIVALADEAGLPVKVLPSVAELVGGSASMRDVRDLQITDLLGRQQIPTDLGAVRSLLQGKRVLITGAGGSIGSEIARQVGACDPAELILLDNDETHLYDVAATVGYPATQALCDIRDVDLLWAAFHKHEPEIVFHAAAHKHVPILEDHPGEAIRTNSLGTRNIVDACNAHHVDRLVFISTDKAVHPSSVMGASKRLAEQIMLTERPEGARYSAVRFGNVLGSRGSVIPTFMRQIAEGGPVTITDERMTRFFMSIPEAVQLVLQAATFSEGGEVFMLDMGEPVRIVDLAERMIRLSGREVGKDVEIRVVGMRPGEKLHEELRAPEEAQVPTAHPSIVALRPVTLPAGVLAEGIDRLCGHVRRREDDLTKDALFALVTRSDVVSIHDLPPLHTTADEATPWNRSTT